MKYLLLTYSILFLFSCKSANDIPGNIIPVDSMKLVMWDMMRTGAYVDHAFSKDSALLEKKYIELYRQVFLLHKITKAEFDESLAYYLQHPDKNKIMLDSLNNFASKQRMERFRKME